VNVKGGVLGVACTERGVLRTGDPLSAQETWTAASRDRREDSPFRANAPRLRGQVKEPPRFRPINR